MMENYVPGCNNRLVVLPMLPMVMMLHFFAVVPLAQHFHVSRWLAYRTALPVQKCYVMKSKDVAKHRYVCGNELRWFGHFFFFYWSSLNKKMSLKCSIFATLFISTYISEMMIDMNNTLTNKYSQLFSGAYTFNLSAF